MKILFQGDSITDCNRKYDDPNDLGEGYVLYAVNALKAAYPDLDLEFINRGISGNRTENLLERVQGDLIDIQPDIVTVLIGVNDTWHKWLIDRETKVEDFTENYEKILKRIKKDTSALLVMMEPFLIYDMGKDHMRADLNEKIDAVRRLAIKYADMYIPLDGIFVSACVTGIDKAQLAPDGVHPGEVGKQLIADLLVSVLSDMIDDIRTKI